MRVMSKSSPLSRSHGSILPFMKGLTINGNGNSKKGDTSPENGDGRSGSPTAPPSPLALHKKKKGNDPFAPYINSLPKYTYGIKLLQGGSLDSESSCASVDGPAADVGDNEGMRYEPPSPLLPEIFGKSITTYPHFPGSPTPQGHPICDRYSVRATKNGTVCAIADGCGWGERPRAAAHDAIQAFLNYMDSRVHKLKDLHRAGVVMLKAFREAQAAIMKHTHSPSEEVKNCLECGECGTTTMLGGLLVPIDSHSGVENVAQPRWGFLCCSVGDCKAFLLSRNRVTEITVGSRYGANDVADCGGRLGPQIGSEPDLRNLSLFFHPCQVGDVIFLVSDGVHDNFDPEQLGKSPQECQLSAEGWAKADRDEAVSIKDMYRTRLLEDTLVGCHTLEQKVAAVLKHCEVTTSSSREWMTEHSGALPKDYERFPGKMDHSTCVALRVPRRSVPDGNAPITLHPSASV